MLLSCCSIVYLLQVWPRKANTQLLTAVFVTVAAVMSGGRKHCWWQENIHLKAVFLCSASALSVKGSWNCRVNDCFLLAHRMCTAVSQRWHKTGLFLEDESHTTRKGQKSGSLTCFRSWDPCSITWGVFSAWAHCCCHLNFPIEL